MNKTQKEINVIEYNKFQKEKLEKKSKAQRSQIIKQKMKNLEKRMNEMKINTQANSNK